MYILYLRCKDANLGFCAWVYLHITTIIASEWLNSLIFHENIKSITANGRTMIYDGTNYIFHVMIVYFLQKNLEVLSHS